MPCGGQTAGMTAGQSATHCSEHRQRKRSSRDGVRGTERGGLIRADLLVLQESAHALQQRPSARGIRHALRVKGAQHSELARRQPVLCKLGEHARQQRDARDALISDLAREVLSETLDQLEQ